MGESAIGTGYQTGNQLKNHNTTFMKRIIMSSLLVLFALGLSAQANAIDSYFQDYVEDEKFSVVYISPRLIQMVERIGGKDLNLDDEEAEAFVDLAADMRGLRILSTDVTPSRYFEEAIGKIDTKLYEPLITIRERHGGRTEFLIKENKDGILEELLFLSYGDSEFTLMSFVGNLNLDKVMKLADEMEDKN